MDETVARSRLAGGGVTGTWRPDEAPAKYNGLADPAGVEALGAALAGELAGARPDAVVIWEEPEDVALGHVVARELGVGVVRAYDADGLVGHSGPLPDGARVALVADAIRDARVVLAARALADRAAGRLVATGCLMGTGTLTELGQDAGTVVVLVRPVEGTDGTA